MVYATGLPACLTPEEAALVAGVHERTIRRLCNDGKIGCGRIGQSWRINSADLVRYFGIDESDMCALLGFRPPVAKSPSC